MWFEQVIHCKVVGPARNVSHDVECPTHPYTYPTSAAREEVNSLGAIHLFHLTCEYLLISQDYVVYI
jgi:hypothetical protein